MKWNFVSLNAFVCFINNVEKVKHINKQKFRSRIRRSETLNLKVLKNTVTEQGGILAISERLGLGRKIEILLARLKKSTRDATPTVYSINTDFHV